MAHISRGFRGRRVDQRDAPPLPPGQYLVVDFPVLSAGPTPYTPSRNGPFPSLETSPSLGRGPGRTSVPLPARTYGPTSTA
jgi:hypothetical protein